MADGRTIIQAISVAIVLLISAQVEGQPGSVSPPFKIVAAGTGDQNITINCSIQDPAGSQSLVWQYSPSWSHQPVPIYTSYDNSVKDPANFSAVTYRPYLQGVQYTAADLTIKVAKPGQAADYTCYHHQQFAVLGVSSFLVLDPIQCPAQDVIEYPVGSIVNITCSVHVYHRDPATDEPFLEIKREDQATPLPPGITTRNESTVTMTSQIVLTIEDDAKEYTCSVRFTDNMPDYTDNCTMIYFVLHKVTDITFNPSSSSDNPTTVAVGDQINCTANGRPVPAIVWYNEQRDVVEEGELLTVTSDMQSLPQPVTLLCVANNSIDGGITYESVEANYTFIVGNAASPSVQTGGVETWVIVVAVVVPIVVLAAIAIAVFFIIRHRKKNKNVTKKTKTTNGFAPGNGSAANATPAYSAVATQELSYSSPSRPPPTSAAPRTTNAVGRGGPPGPDSRNGAIRVGDSPGFGDLGVQTYGGSNQAVNAYPTRNSANGSIQALGGGGGGVSMNPNPGYPRASNPALNSSVSSSTATRPNYPYQGSNSNINNTSLSMNQNNPAAAAMMLPGAQNASYGRQPSIASSSGRSHASNYNSGIVPGQVTDPNRFQSNDLSSMHGSEV